MPVQTRQRLPVHIVIGFALLLAMVVSSLWFARAQIQASNETRRLFEHELTLVEILSALKDVEASQRGYLLTGDALYLAPYRESVARVYRAREALARNTGPEPDTVALGSLVTSKLEEIERTVALAGAGRIEDARAIVRTDFGERLMQRLRAIIGEARGETKGQIDALNERIAHFSYLLSAGLVTGLLAVIGLAWMWMRNHSRQLRLLLAARDEAEAGNQALRTQIEAREAAETQVRQIQKMESIGQLTGGIAHDFNNMLAIVIGSLDLAKRRLTSDPAKVGTYLDNAREGADRAAQLTARLLAFSRQQPLAPSPTDANKLVSGMSEMLRRTLGEPVRVETVLAGGLWRCYVDPTQLENALLNLAVNARDAMPEGGRLTIETQNAHLDDDYARGHEEVEAGQYVCVCVSDTGTGMTKEVIERAFDPFFTTKSVGKGTGLGLSQVFGFLKQSGGHIKIYSEIGEGTTIRLYLPRWFGVERGSETGPESMDLPLGAADEFILVVEDEMRVRHMSVDALRELGYTVIQASNANQALEQLRQQPRIDLLFTDVVMPDMNGRRLAELARELRSDLKVLYTTGYTRNAVVHNGMLDPGVAFLPKPFTMDQLARKVREVLDGGGVNRLV